MEGPVVRGLVYEYCPGKTLGDWGLNLLRDAAQQAEMQKQYPTAVYAVRALSSTGSGWFLPTALAVQIKAVAKTQRRALLAAHTRPLQARVLEQPLKQHMRRLLVLLAQMSSGSSTSSSRGGSISSTSGAGDGGGSSSSGGGSSGGSGSSHPSATAPPGGLVFHGDIKPSNTYIAADGTAKLGDWGTALYCPDATSQQQLTFTGHTFDFCAPEVLLPHLNRLAPRKKPHPSSEPVLVCEDRGRADTWSLLVTWLTVLSGVGPYWWVPDGSDRQDDVRSFLVACYETHEVMECALNIHYQALLSPAALAFFKEALVADPKGRTTPARLLQHAYVKE